MLDILPVILFPLLGMNRGKFFHHILIHSYLSCALEHMETIENDLESILSLSDLMDSDQLSSEFMVSHRSQIIA